MATTSDAGGAAGSDGVDYEAIGNEVLVTVALAYHEPYEWDEISPREQVVYIDAAQMAVAEYVRQRRAAGYQEIRWSDVPD